MDSVNPVLLYYDIILMVSVVLSGIYLFMWHKHFDAHITIIFVMIPVICLGYALRVHATGLETVLAANKLVYLGGCFLQLFVLLAIVNLCNIRMEDRTGPEDPGLCPEHNRVCLCPQSHEIRGFLQKRRTGDPGRPAAFAQGIRLDAYRV